MNDHVDHADPEAVAMTHDPAVVLAADLDLPELADSYEEAQARMLADRFLRALRGVQDEAAANAAELKQTIAFYEERHAERQAVLERRESWLVTQLRSLFGFLPLRGKAKSVNLLGGRLGTRMKSARYTITDEAALLAWAKEHVPQLVSTPPVKERVLVSDLADWLKGTGTLIGEVALPPGVERIDAREEFFADPAALDTP